MRIFLVVMCFYLFLSVIPVVSNIPSVVVLQGLISSESDDASSSSTMRYRHPAVVTFLLRPPVFSVITKHCFILLRNNIQSNAIHFSFNNEYWTYYSTTKSLLHHKTYEWFEQKNMSDFQILLKFQHFNYHFFGMNSDELRHFLTFKITMFVRTLK